MSEPTPESTPSKPLSDAPPEVRSGEGLAPVPIRPSRGLFIGLLLTVCLMAVLPAAALALGRPATTWHWLALQIYWGALGLEYGRFHRSRRQLPRAVACERGVWQLAWADNHWRDADPVGVWHLWHWLQIIRLRERDDGRRWTLIWLPDSAGAEDRRRLRVWLRLGRWEG